MLRRAPLLLLLLLLLLTSCGRDHLQSDGRYAFSTTAIFRDDCRLLSLTEPAALWDAELVVAGDTVRMTYDLFNIQMAGFYLANVEKFTADGSVANVTRDVNGNACLLDLASIHLDATTESAAEFTGSLRIRFEARRPDTCICEATGTFRAVQQ